MKKVVLAFVSALFLAGFTQGAFAQQAEKISSALDVEEISKGTAAYFTCVYANLADESVSDSAAFDILETENIFGADENVSERIDLSEVCFVIAKSMGMKGGIFYSIFKTPRYAFREFKAKGIVPQSAEPEQSVSGSEFMAMLSGFEKQQRKGR